MARTFTVYRRITTDAPAEQVFAAVEHSLRSTVGGSIRRKHNSFHVTDGTNNLNFAWLSDLSAIITLTEPAAGFVDIHGIITVRPSTEFWVFFWVGFLCMFFLWIINLLFFFIDPRKHYQTALDGIQILPHTVSPAAPPIILEEVSPAAPPIILEEKPAPQMDRWRL